MVNMPGKGLDKIDASEVLPNPNNTVQKFLLALRKTDEIDLLLCSQLTDLLNGRDVRNFDRTRQSGYRKEADQEGFLLVKILCWHRAEFPDKVLFTPFIVTKVLSAITSKKAVDHLFVLPAQPSASTADSPPAQLVSTDTAKVHTVLEEIRDDVLALAAAAEASQQIPESEKTENPEIVREAGESEKPRALQRSEKVPSRLFFRDREKFIRSLIEKYFLSPGLSPQEKEQKISALYKDPKNRKEILSFHDLILKHGEEKVLSVASALAVEFYNTLKKFNSDIQSTPYDRINFFFSMGFEKYLLDHRRYLKKGHGLSFRGDPVLDSFIQKRMSQRAFGMNFWMRFFCDSGNKLPDDRSKLKSWFLDKFSFVSTSSDDNSPSDFTALDFAFDDCLFNCRREKKHIPSDQFLCTLGHVIKNVLERREAGDDSSPASAEAAGGGLRQKSGFVRSYAIILRIPMFLPGIPKHWKIIAKIMFRRGVMLLISIVFCKIIQRNLIGSSPH